jgi:hypothetical protein
MMEGYAPGAQNRGAYPHTGPNYSYWGDLTHYGLVYDPYLDAYRRDPRAQQAYYESQGWIEPPPQQPKPPSTMQQVGMMALPTALQVGGQWVGQQIAPAAAAAPVAYDPNVGGVIMSDGSVNLVGGGTIPANSGAQAAGSGQQGGLLSAARDRVGSWFGGGSQAGAQSSGQIGSGVGSQGIQGAQTASTGTPNFAIGQPSYAGYLGAAIQAGQAAKALGKRDRSRTDTAQDFAQNAALAVANVYTGGLAGLAHGLLMKTGTGRKIDKGIKKFDKKLGWLSPTKQLSTAMGTFGIGQKSTKAHQADRMRHLIDTGVTGYEDFANQTYAGDQEYRDQFKDRIGNSAGLRKDLAPDFVGIDPASGRWINNAYAQSGDLSTLRPEDAWGSVGAFRTFGSDWLGKLNEEQRRKITQGLLSEGLFHSDKGDLLVSDPNRAQQIYNEIMGA